MTERQKGWTSLSIGIALLAWQVVAPWFPVVFIGAGVILFFLGLDYLGVVDGHRYL